MFACFSSIRNRISSELPFPLSSFSNSSFTVNLPGRHAPTSLPRPIYSTQNGPEQGILTISPPPELFAQVCACSIHFYPVRVRVTSSLFWLTAGGWRVFLLPCQYSTLFAFVTPISRSDLEPFLLRVFSVFYEVPCPMSEGSVILPLPLFPQFWVSLCRFLHRYLRSFRSSRIASLM